MHRGTCVCEGLPMHPSHPPCRLSETACAHPHWGAAHWCPPRPPFAAPAHPSCGRCLAHRSTPA
eukprot:815335-Pyramimonas_sp.AAC.1